LQLDNQHSLRQHYILDKQEAIALKDELENEMKLYLKGALKKLMHFKKELKADLLFTK
jgi:hypothetical protein